MSLVDRDRDPAGQHRRGKCVIPAANRVRFQHRAGRYRNPGQLSPGLDHGLATPGPGENRLMARLKEKKEEREERGDPRFEKAVETLQNLREEKRELDNPALRNRASKVGVRPRE